MKQFAFGQVAFFRLNGGALMIQVLIGFVALLLFVVGFYLVKKQEVFLVLIPDEEENKSFLSQFGSIYLFLGVAGLVVAILNDRIYALLFLIALLSVAAVFSILFSQKMSSSN